jgi:hypothetical protein
LDGLYLLSFQDADHPTVHLIPTRCVGLGYIKAFSLPLTAMPLRGSGVLPARLKMCRRATGDFQQRWNGRRGVGRDFQLG